MVRILSRYILREIAGPFSLILGIFLFVLLMGRILKIVEMIVRQGVSLWDILRLLGFLIPSFLPLAIPMATLIAGVLCFSRLSGDMEITALKASGISLYQMLPPVALFAVAMSLATLFLTLQGAPWGASAFRELAFLLAKKHISVAIKEGVFNEVFPGFVVYAEQVRAQDGAMEGIFINDQHSSEVPFQILAKRGSFVKGGGRDEVLSLRLENGTMYQISAKEGKVRRIHFDAYEVNLDLSLAQAQERLRSKRSDEWDIRHIVTTMKQRLSRGRAVKDFLIEIHRRLAIAAGCLIFGLLALPLALQSRPRGRSHGFLLGTLVILIYYLLFSAGRTLAETGRVPIWLALWAPNILFGGFCAVLLVRTAQERPSAALLKLNALIDAVQRRMARLAGGGA
jgi:lipopolysaccharide export system permease protein